MSSLLEPGRVSSNGYIIFMRTVSSPLGVKMYIFGIMGYRGEETGAMMDRVRMIV